MQNNIIENIRNCGQSLIDNAENIVLGLPKYTTNLSLTCYPDEEDQSIYVNVSYDFIPEKLVDRYRESDEKKED